MWSTNGHIWDVWNSGLFIGDDGEPQGRVTIEPDWYLEMSGAVVGTYTKGPVRSFQRADNSQVELELPNIATLEIDESIDSDAATCRIEIDNQIQMLNSSTDEPAVVGDPGYFSWSHGDTSEAAARWGQDPNSWSNLLIPNMLVRSYSGYGGREKTIPQAVADGNIRLSGVWLIDEVQVSVGGKITMNCRSMAKLLLEQLVFPPLVPPGQYPMARCRWSFSDFIIPGTPSSLDVHDQQSKFGICTGLGSENTGNALWYPGPSFGVFGHQPSDAFDGDIGTFWLSVGNDRPDLPFALEWIEICCDGQDVNDIYLHPEWGNYTVYISVWENGGWVDGSDGQVISYDAAGIGRYTGANTANIPWVVQSGVPFEEPIDILLPRVYKADKIRISFTNLQYTPFGTDDGHFHYRAGLKECRARIAYNVPSQPAQHGMRRGDGNYFDYADIVRDLFLWAGFNLRGAFEQDGSPSVYGNIEKTGIYSDDCINEDVFDKKPVIDVLNTFKNIVGYGVWVDSEGAAHFESQNTWGPGNFLANGSHTAFIPEIDERLQLTQYGVSFKDRGVVSEIIISSEQPDLSGQFNSTITTRFVPPSAQLLRGIVKPFGWVNLLFQNADEQRILAELVAMQIFFQLRQGSLTCPDNPNIGINDQIRIWERETSESSIHYVRGVSRKLDRVSGQSTMTLTTHWLGGSSAWVVQPQSTSSQTFQAAPIGSAVFEYSERLAAFLKLSEARSVVTARLSRAVSSTVVSPT